MKSNVVSFIDNQIGDAMFFTGIEFGEMIGDVFRIHQQFPRLPHKAFRKHEKVPYGVHPTCCALMLLHEELLSPEFRVRGAKALLGHDFLEDTTLAVSELPDWCKEDAVLMFIQGMTFLKTEDPYEGVWKRGEEVILLKLYDYTDNLMNVGTFDQAKQEERKAHVRELVSHVRARYGELYVIRFAEALLK